MLITGGCGFIGTNLVRLFLKQTSDRIVNVDKISYAANPHTEFRGNFPQRYCLVEKDLASWDGLTDLIRDFRPNLVFHLAAESHVDRSISNPFDFVANNVLGAQRLLEAVTVYYSSLTQGQRSELRVVHCSTDEVFGDLRREDPPFDENSVYRPSSPYAASKAAADHLMHAWFRTYGVPVINSNCTNNYGPFQHREKLIPCVIHACLAGEQIRLYGDGQNIRDWIHVDDHCRAMLALAEHGTPGESYVVGARNEISNVDLVCRICRILDGLRPPANVASYRDLMLCVEDRPGHDFRYAVDPVKLESDTPWKPRIDFGEGLESTVSWYIQRSEIPLAN